MQRTRVKRVDGDTAYVDVTMLQHWRNGHFGMFSRKRDMDPEPNGNPPILVPGDLVAVRLNRFDTTIVHAQKVEAAQ